MALRPRGSGSVKVCKQEARTSSEYLTLFRKVSDVQNITSRAVSRTTDCGRGLFFKAPWPVIIYIDTLDAHGCFIAASFAPRALAVTVGRGSREASREAAPLSFIPGISVVPLAKLLTQGGQHPK